MLNLGTGMSKKKGWPRLHREKVGRGLVHAPKVSMTLLCYKKAEPYKLPPYVVFQFSIPSRYSSATREGCGATKEACADMDVLRMDL
jgi:hypothetical protein